VVVEIECVAEAAMTAESGLDSEECCRCRWRKRLTVVDRGVAVGSWGSEVGRGHGDFAAADDGGTWTAPLSADGGSLPGDGFTEVDPPLASTTVTAAMVVSLPAVWAVGEAQRGQTS